MHSSACWLGDAKRDVSFVLRKIRLRSSTEALFQQSREIWMKNNLIWFKKIHNLRQISLSTEWSQVNLIWAENVRKERIQRSESKWAVEISFTWPEIRYPFQLISQDAPQSPFLHQKLTYKTIYLFWSYNKQRKTARNYVVYSSHYL